jgi:Flp pilus assembly protein TadG
MIRMPLASTRGRGGAILSAELLLILPMLLLLLYGFLVLSQIMLARQTLAVAAREGARAGALTHDTRLAEYATRRTLAAAGPLAQASVKVTFTNISTDNNGSENIVVVSVSAPVGLATLWIPQLVVNAALRDSQLVEQAIMRVE